MEKRHKYDTQIEYLIRIFELSDCRPNMGRTNRALADINDGKTPALDLRKEGTTIEVRMTSTKFNSQPLYMRLRSSLVARISSGEWSPGLCIPNENELAREYGLSPGTVRKTLDWMEHAKLVVRMQGRGTFVLDPASGERVNLYERLREATGSRVSDELGATVVTVASANASECARLHLAPGETVRRANRCRLLAGAPYMIENSVVPAALFPLDGDAAHSDHALMELAKRCGVLLGKGEERISAENASDELATSLACTVGDALLRLERTVFTIDGKPAEWRVGYCRLRGHYYSTSVGPEN